MNEAPAIEVHIVQNFEPPGGMGEPGTSAIVPAVTNAIFAAAGQALKKAAGRLRRVEAAGVNETQSPDPYKDLVVARSHLRRLASENSDVSGAVAVETMSSNRPSLLPSSSAPASATRRASILPTACRTSAQQSQCLHRYFIRSTGLSSERRSSSPMTTRRNPACSYSDHIFSVSSQCRRTHRPSDILPSFSDPTLLIARQERPQSVVCTVAARSIWHHRATLEFGA